MPELKRKDYGYDLFYEPLNDQLYKKSTVAYYGDESKKKEIKELKKSYEKKKRLMEAELENGMEFTSAYDSLKRSAKYTNADRPEALEKHNKFYMKLRDRYKRGKGNEEG